MYGLTHGVPVRDSGRAACFLASKVISHVGARLPHRTERVLERSTTEMKEVLKKDFEKFSLTVKVPPDNLKLFIDIKPKSAGLEITRDLLLSALGEAGCAQGVVVMLDDIVLHLKSEMV